MLVGVLWADPCPLNVQSDNVIPNYLIQLCVSEVKGSCLDTIQKRGEILFESYVAQTNQSCVHSNTMCHQLGADCLETTMLVGSIYAVEAPITYAHMSPSESLKHGHFDNKDSMNNLMGYKRRISNHSSDRDHERFLPLAFSRQTNIMSGFCDASIDAIWGLHRVV